MHRGRVGDKELFYVYVIYTETFPSYGRRLQGMHRGRVGDKELFYVYVIYTETFPSYGRRLQGMHRGRVGDKELFYVYVIYTETFQETTGSASWWCGRQRTFLCVCNLH